jgi:hypothetical protein
MDRIRGADPMRRPRIAARVIGAWHEAQAAGEAPFSGAATACGSWQALHSGFVGSANTVACGPLRNAARSAAWHEPHTLSTSLRPGATAPCTP